MKSRTAARHVGRTLYGTLALAATGAAAQAVDPPPTTNARPFYLIPSVAVSAELTNNVNLTPTNKQSDLIGTIAPSIQLGGQSGQIKGFLDYTLTANAYARDRESSNLQNYLNAHVDAELVNNWAFVVANAQITQQYVNPFGVQSPNGALGTSNRTEVYSFDVAPRLSGQLAGLVNYQAIAEYGYTNSGTSAAGDNSYIAGLLRFDANTRWSKLSWAVNLSYRKIDFSSGNSNFDQLAIAALKYAVRPDLRVSLRGNVESSNLASPERETTTGWGGGIEWNPSPRTRLFIEADQRSFGSSHLYGLEYRTPRTVWSVSSRQGLSNGNYNGGQGNSGSAFDLLFTQFASVEADPVARAQLVKNFMQANGIAPGTSLNSGYLTEQVTYELRQEASAALMGARSTLIFNIYQTQARALAGSPSPPGSQFADGNVIRWRGFGLTLAHRLTPQSTLTLTAAQQQTSESVGSQYANLWTANALWAVNLAPRVQVSVGARYADSSGDSPYTEAALSANLNWQF